MNKRIRNTSLSVLIALVLLALANSAAYAVPLKNLHMEVVDIVGASGETFVASGDAVDNGVVCATGTVDDLSVEPSGGSGTYTILHVVKRFYCDDGSGTFDIKMLVRLNNTTLQTSARWKFVGGTGSYTSLHGQGYLQGTPVVPGTSILDVYDGWAF